MKHARILAAAGTGLLLAACTANPYELDRVDGMTDAGTDFQAALHEHYTERARFEADEHDWMDSVFFSERAMAAANGRDVPVQAPDARGLSGGAPEAAYDRLTRVLATQAPVIHPDACARAQTWYEHWVEQLEEGHQPDHIAMTRQGYEEAIAECVPPQPEPKAEPAPEPEPMPGPFTVLFPLDDSGLTETAQKTIDRIVAAARDADPSVIRLVGHADRAGSEDYNLRLSARRIAIVMEALEEAGVDARLPSEPRGETEPAVETEDGVPEDANRRVTVMFKR